MVKARKYVVVKAFDGVPKRDDFQIVEEELPPIKNGEILVQAEYISVDPYLRAYAPNCTVPYDQFSFQVGKVLDSKDPKYPVGSSVVSHVGWRDYSIINMSNNPVENRRWAAPKLGSLPISHAVGAVGMPGATAYSGFLNLCSPQPGETVVVTGAAGAVGSIVGQIAKIKGCRVIGFAGSDDKVKILKEEYGFDEAINYKTADIASALKAAAPKGVDCYFDNVGGEISSIIISQMNTFGRVAVCGSISAYNENQKPKATIIQPALVGKQLKVEGFLVWRWAHEMPAAFKQLTAWIRDDKIKADEHVTEGFDNLYEAFVGMLRGDNIGKAVVKV